MVGSSHANLYASIASGVLALWGPLHGGANQAVLTMLQEISNDGGNVQKYVEKAKDKMTHSIDGIWSPRLQKFRSTGKID